MTHAPADAHSSVNGGGLRRGRSRAIGRRSNGTQTSIVWVVLETFVCDTVDFMGFQQPVAANVEVVGHAKPTHSDTLEADNFQTNMSHQPPYLQQSLLLLSLPTPQPT